MNFALMFALALGIDYALFIVVRFRAALLRRAGSPPSDAVAETMDTAGKAVLFSRRDRADLALGRDARAVPRRSARWRSGSWSRSSSSSRRRSRCCPPCSASSARRSTTSRCHGCTPASTARRASPRWGERLWRRPLRYGALALVVLLALALPGPRPEDRDAVDQGRPDRRHARASATRRCRPRSARARPARSSSSRPARTPRRAAAIAEADPGIATRHARAAGADGRYALVQAIPSAEPVRPRRSARTDRPPPRGAARRRPRRRRRRREPRPRDAARRRQTPLVIGVVLALGFLLLLIALQAPMIAARRRAHQPARDGRGVRRRAADLPGRAPLRRSWASSPRASSTRGGRSSSSR